MGSPVFGRTRISTMPSSAAYSGADSKGVDLGGPDIVFGQIKALQNQISKTAKQYRDIRAGSYAKYNVAELAHIITRTFEHFRTHKGPLNFHDILQGSASPSRCPITSPRCSCTRGKSKGW